MIHEAVCIHLLVRREMSSTSDASVLIDLLEAHLPGLTPVVYGEVEPYNARFERERLAEAWSAPFLWRGAARSEGFVLPRYPHHYHATISLTAAPSEIDGQAAAQFLREAAVGLEADFACVQLLTAEEVRVAPGPTIFYTDIQTRTRPFLVLTTHMLRECIPDLYWATVLGPPYVRLFTRERLAGAPAHTSEPLGDESWYLQLTGDLDGFREPARHREIESTRRAIKSHLGDEAFAPPGALERVPAEFRDIPQPSGSVLLFTEDALARWRRQAP